jgi:hypothetical protein
MARRIYQGARGDSDGHAGEEHSDPTDPQVFHIRSGYLLATVEQMRIGTPKFVGVSH